MLSIEIHTGNEGKFPITHPHTGLAKSEKIAKEVFRIAGWGKPEFGRYPGLAVEVGRVEWPEGDLYFPCNHVELFVLNSRLIMN